MWVLELNPGPSEAQGGGSYAAGCILVLLVPGCVISGLPLPFCEPASAPLCEFNSATIMGVCV